MWRVVFCICNSPTHHLGTIVVRKNAHVPALSGVHVHQVHLLQALVGNAVVESSDLETIRANRGAKTGTTSSLLVDELAQPLVLRNGGRQVFILPVTLDPIGPTVARDGVCRRGARRGPCLCPVVGRKTDHLPFLPGGEVAPVKLIHPVVPNLVREPSLLEGVGFQGGVQRDMPAIQELLAEIHQVGHLGRCSIQPLVRFVALNFDFLHPAWV